MNLIKQLQALGEMQLAEAVQELRIGSNERVTLCLTKDTPVLRVAVLDYRKGRISLDQGKGKYTSIYGIEYLKQHLRDTAHKGKEQIIILVENSWHQQKQYLNMDAMHMLMTSAQAKKTSTERLNKGLSALITELAYRKDLVLVRLPRVCSTTYPCPLAAGTIDLELARVKQEIIDPFFHQINRIDTSELLLKAYLRGDYISLARGVISLGQIKIIEGKAHIARHGSQQWQLLDARSLQKIVRGNR